MNFIDFMKQLLALFGGEAIESTTRKIQEKNDEKELQEKIESFLERKSVENGRYSITEEYDYEGLLLYFQKNLVQDVREYITLPPDEQPAHKKSIISKAESSALANSIQSKRMIHKIVDTTIDIISDYYREKATITERVLANQLTKNVTSKIENAVDKIIDAVENSSSPIVPSLFDLEGEIKSKKEIVLNQAVFPWFYNSIKYREAFAAKLFVAPVFASTITYKDLLMYSNTNLVFLGPAGAGKSTMLIYLFASSIITDTRVLYLTAKEAKNNIDKLEAINAYPLLNGNNHLLMIDSIDEAFFNDYNGYEQFIEKLKGLGNCRFWLGCRTDFYTTYFGENTSIAQETIELQPWKELQYNHFISVYAEICKQADLHSKVDTLLGNNESNQKMKTNPFQLSLVVFLSSEGNTEPVSGVFELYESFLNKWIDREIKRGSCDSSKEEIIDTLRNAADSIYTKSEWVLDSIAQNNSAVSCLLIRDQPYLSNTQTASAFYHRSLAAFILAHDVVDAFIHCDYEKAQRLLKRKLKDDVTNFIGDKFRVLSLQEKERIKENLQKLYYHCRENDDSLSYHEQIIYFITRLGVNVNTFLLNVINRNPQNPIMKLTLSYGCVLSDDTRIRQYALDYAESISTDSVDALTNRGWTVVYFGDVNDRDPYSYLDDEKRSWKKAREARIKRFSKANPRLKDVRFWLFDIPLFHSFLRDRNWDDLSEEEFDIIHSLEITNKYFNEKEIAFLEKEKTSLLAEYKEHL